MTTYENTRHFLLHFTDIQSSRTRALIGGGCASLVGQTIIVPFDVVSQHMMVLGNLRRKTFCCPQHINELQQTDPLNLAKKLQSDANRRTLGYAVSREIYRRDGLRGFYRGYLASLLCFVPNGALFWSFYTWYSGILAAVECYVPNVTFQLCVFLHSDQYKRLAPDSCSHLLIQVLAAPSSGITTSFLTNPLDLVRARLQVCLLRLNFILLTFGNFFSRLDPADGTS